MSFFAEKVMLGDQTLYEVTVLDKGTSSFKKVYRFDAYFFPID